jgi:3',5'-cyclic AMP phosphodiesterase CpdA
MIPGRIVHLSDLHVGAHGDGLRALEGPLRALVEELDPELVVASGDLTHRNRSAQHARAASLLRALGPPVLALPGNHDVPGLPPRRLLKPFGAFLSEWPAVEPVHRSDSVVAVGLNSVRPWRYQRGAISDAQLARAAALLAAAPRDALRVVAFHHHLATPPWRTGKRTVPRRSHVLTALAQGGAELVLGGHTHQSLVVEQREFLGDSAGARSVVLASAPGLGRPRPGRHAEASGLQVVDAEPRSLGLRTYAARDGRFELVAERFFPRSRS